MTDVGGRNKTSDVADPDDTDRSRKDEMPLRSQRCREQFTEVAPARKWARDLSREWHRESLPLNSRAETTAGSAESKAKSGGNVSTPLFVAMGPAVPWHHRPRDRPSPARRRRLHGRQQTDGSHLSESIAPVTFETHRCFAEPTVSVIISPGPWAWRPAHRAARMGARFGLPAGRSSLQARQALWSDFGLFFCAYRNRADECDAAAGAPSTRWPTEPQ